MEMNEILYKLIYHRKFREAFIANKLEGLALSSQQLEDLSFIDKDQLNKSSQKIIEQLLGIDGSLSLKKAFPQVFSEWQRLFPQDNECFELAYFFLESQSFQDVKNLDFGGSQNIFEAFREFLLLKLPQNEKYSRLRQAVYSDL